MNLIKQFLRNRNNKKFIDFIGINERNRRVPFKVYGRVIRLEPKTIIKVAWIIDTVIPLTLFIPVILAYCFKFITQGKGIMIER